jgi:hypothetical protein
MMINSNGMLRISFNPELQTQDSNGQYIEGIIENPFWVVLPRSRGNTVKPLFEGTP